MRSYISSDTFRETISSFEAIPSTRAFPYNFILFSIIFAVMDWQHYITSETGTRSGKPIIQGTRLTVELIIGRLADGWTYDQLLENYPNLKAEHIQAVLAFVNECMIDGMLVYPIPRKAG